MGFGLRCSPAVASSLCYNFFFLPPLYTFTITDPTNLAAFVFFTADGGSWSRIVAARGALPDRLAARESRPHAVELLYAFSRKLAGGRAPSMTSSGRRRTRPR